MYINYNYKAKHILFERVLGLYFNKCMTFLSKDMKYEYCIWRVEGGRRGCQYICTFFWYFD